MSDILIWEGFSLRDNFKDSIQFKAGDKILIVISPSSTDIGVNGGLIHQVQSIIDNVVTIFPRIPSPPSNENIRIQILARTHNMHSRVSQLNKDIYVYSFALNPEEHQPSGTCNFSRLNNSRISYSDLTKIDNVYALSYNILKIKGGMSITAFSN